MNHVNEVYYFNIIPKKIHVHKSIVFNVHPLTKFKVILEKNSLFQDAMNQWMYAGSQHGVIEIDSRPIKILYENQQKISVYTLKLMQIQHKIQKEVDIVSKTIENQELIGKQILPLKSYITKFKSNNIHYFQQKSRISTQFMLQYEIFVQKTVEALQRIILQHSNINQQTRLGNESLGESVLSDIFSDKINEIEVKGENRLAEHVALISNDALLRSEGKMVSQDFIFTSVNKKRDKKIIRSKDASVRVKLEERFTTKRQHTIKKLQQLQQTKNDEDSTFQSSELKSIVLKKLSSQEVKPTTLELQSSRKLKTKQKKLTLITYYTDDKLESNSEKRRKLIEKFEAKRLQFKRKIDESKQPGKQRLISSTDRKGERQLSRYGSTKSMRTVRLSQWEKLPEKQPWVRKQKQITQVRNKKLLYFIVFFMLIVLYFLMQPFKNVESPLTKNEIQHQQKKKQSQKKADKKKSKFKIKSV